MMHSKAEMSLESVTPIESFFKRSSETLVKKIRKKAKLVNTQTEQNMSKFPEIANVHVTVCLV